MASSRIRGITIEIGGDTTKLTKALSKVDSALTKTQTNLRDISKALKFDPTSTALLRTRQKELAKEIELTKSKIDTEKEAYKQLSEADKTPENVEKMRQLKTQIDLDTASLKDLESQAKQAASVLGSQMQAAGAKMQALGQKIQSVGNSLASLGRRMTTAVTVPVVAGFTAAVKTAGSFDAAMSKVQATSGATAEDMQLLRDKAKEMGESTKFSASESAEALNYMAMAGWKTQDMLDGIAGVMNLAAASGEELGTTSDIVTDALTAFNMSADQAGRFGDILAAAASNANTNVAMMGESFKYVAPVAGSLGYSAEDVAVALGLMANAGIKADMAGTSLRNIFTRMAKPTKESAEAMDRLGLSLYNDEGQMYSFREIMDQLRGSFTEINMSIEDYDAAVALLDDQLAEGTLTQSKYDKALEELNLQAFGAEGAEKARAAAMLGGTRAMAGLLAITNASEADYEKLTSAIDGSSEAMAKLEDGSVVPLSQALANGDKVMETYEGTAAAMAAVMGDNLNGQITILKSQLEALAISIGEILMPYIRQVVSLIQAWVDKFNALDEAEKIQIMKMAGLAAAIGPVVTVIGTLVSGVGKLVSLSGTITAGAGKLMTTLSAANPVVLGIVAAVTALAGGFVYLFKTNEDFRASMSETFGNMQTVMAGALETAAPMVDRLKEAFGGLAQTFDTIMQACAPLFEFIGTSVMALVAGIFNMIGPLIQFISGAITVIQGVIEAFIAVIEGDNVAFGAALETILKGIGEMLLAVINGFIQFVVGVLNTFGANIKNVFMITGNTVKTVVANMWNALKTAFTNGFNVLKSKAKAGLDSLKNIFSNLKTDLKATFDNVVTSMKNWGKDMIDGLIKGIKEKIQGVKDAVSGVADTIKGYLHFSVPDEGPLKDFDTYAPDMMKLFAQGITANAGLITRAISGAFNLQPLLSNKSLRLPDQSTQALASQAINVNVTLQGDAYKMFRVISAEASRNKQLTGTMFA